jgi:hypothetical protein
MNIHFLILLFLIGVLRAIWKASSKAKGICKGFSLTGSFFIDLVDFFAINTSYKKCIGNLNALPLLNTKDLG